MKQLVFMIAVAIAAGADAQTGVETYPPPVGPATGEKGKSKECAR